MGPPWKEGEIRLGVDKVVIELAPHLALGTTQVFAVLLFREITDLLPVMVNYATLFDFESNKLTHLSLTEFCSLFIETDSPFGLIEIFVLLQLKLPVDYFFNLGLFLFSFFMNPSLLFSDQVNKLI